MIGYWMIIVRRCRWHRPMDSIVSCSCRSWQRKIQSWKVCVSYISTKNAECTWPGFLSVLESPRIFFVKFSSKAWKVVQQNSAVLSTLWILFWQDQITRLWPLSRPTSTLDVLFLLGHDCQGCRFTIHYATNMVTMTVRWATKFMWLFVCGKN